MGKLPAASSALIRDDVAYLMAGHLIALDLKGYRPREQPAVKGNRLHQHGRKVVDNTAQDDSAVLMLQMETCCGRSRVGG